MKMHGTIFLVLSLITLLGTVSFQTASAEDTEDNISPKKQTMSGADVHEIQCKEGFELILKVGDWSPACCKSSSVDKLIERGWAADHDTTHNIMMESMINLPEDTIDKDKAMTEAKEMMKEAAENPTLISEDINEMVGDEEDTDKVQVLKTGEFKGADFFHSANGQAKIIKTGDQTFLRFEMFEVTNGPDLRVYLTNDRDVKAGLHLEKLKGSNGNQNYMLDDIDWQKYDTVVIYCQPFGVHFGYAKLA